MRVLKGGFVIRTRIILCALILTAVSIGCDDDLLGPFGDLTPPRGGCLWVVKNGISCYISKVDLSTFKRVDKVGAPVLRDYFGKNLGLAFGDGKLWASWVDYGTAKYYYCWIDPETGERGPSIRIDEHLILPEGLAWDGSNLWVAGGAYYGLFDPYSGELIRKQTLNYGRIYGLAWDGSRLWLPAREYVDYEPIWFIYELDPDTGEITSRIPSPCEGTTGLTWDGEALWVNDVKENTVYRVSPNNGAVLGYFEYDFGASPYGLAFEFPSE